MTAETTPQRTQAILSVSLHTLTKNPTLAWFPILAALGALGALIVAGLVSGLLGELGPPESHRDAVVGGLVAYVGVRLVTVGCGVALARATADTLADRPWSVRGILRNLRPRLRAIATVAVLDAGIGRMLASSRKTASWSRRLQNTWLRGTWWGLTYLIVPVLAREDRSGLASVHRSGTLFRQTWKEAFIGRLTIGWLWLPFLLIVLLPLGLCAALKIDDTVILAIAIGVPAALAGAAALFLSTLDTVYRTALYIFATEGVIPEPFEHPDLHEVFRTR